MVWLGWWRGNGVRSGLGCRVHRKSGRGLPHSKTLARSRRALGELGCFCLLSEGGNGQRFRVFRDSAAFAMNQTSGATKSGTKNYWPHAPKHELTGGGTYFVTGSTYRKERHFRTAERVDVLHRGLLKVAQDFGWRLEAWAVFSIIIILWGIRLRREFR
jgi:hypothetical protein